jgi:hypothetical protein
VQEWHRTRDAVIREKARDGWTFRRRRRAQLECSNSIRGQDVKDRLSLRNERATSNGIRGRSRRQQLRLDSTGNVNETVRETPRAGDHEDSSRDFRLVVKNE